MYFERRNFCSNCILDEQEEEHDSERMKHSVDGPAIAKTGKTDTAIVLLKKLFL